MFEKNGSYWGGWDALHFEKAVLKVVSEVATRRQLIENGEVDVVDSLSTEDAEALRLNLEVDVASNSSTQSCTSR